MYTRHRVVKITYVPLLPIRLKNAIFSTYETNYAALIWKVRLFYYYFLCKVLRTMSSTEVHLNVNFCGFVKVSPRPNRIEIAWIYVYVRAWCVHDKSDKQWLLWLYIILSIRIGFSFNTYQSIYNIRTSRGQEEIFFFVVI